MLGATNGQLKSEQKSALIVATVLVQEHMFIDYREDVQYYY